MLGDIMTVKDWQIKYGIFSCDLEEVEERVELEIYNLGSGVNGRLQKKAKNGFTQEEKELCEKALNGELFTKDDLYQFAQNCLFICEGEYFSPDLLDSIFKEIKE